MRLAMLLAWRFQRGRQKDKFVGFVSLASLCGITLGCFALILLLSVMNGFERELKHRILSVIPHGELTSVSNEGIASWSVYREQLLAIPEVATISPFVRIEGLIVKGTQFVPVQISGLSAEEMRKSWARFASTEAISNVLEEENALLLGQGILNKYGLAIGDVIQIMVPDASSDVSFRAPRVLTVSIAGALNIGGDIDYQVGITSLKTAAREMGIVTGAQGLKFMFHDAFSAPALMRQIGYQFPQAAYMSDWTRTHGHLYQDIRLVRVVVYIVLALVIGVACFNIVSTLVMRVREKHKAIGILRSMGATDSLIRSTFIIQGLLTGITGTCVGVGSALLMVPRLPDLVLRLENSLDIRLLEGDLYFVNVLPVELSLIDITVTASISILLSFIATIYPANRAVKLAPAKAVAGG